MGFKIIKKGMKMEKFYIMEGHSPVICGRLTWCKWFGKANRTVKDTYVGNVHVSTVFMGIDHLGVVPPKVFETAVYKCDLHLKTIRHSTWTEALIGHDDMVKKIKIWEKNLRKFKLIQEVKVNGPGAIKVVEPLKPITYREVQYLTNNKSIVLIDDKQFTVRNYKRDLFPFKPDDEFRFMGEKLISFFVKNR